MEKLLRKKCELLQSLLNAQGFLVNTQKELEQLNAEIAKLDTPVPTPVE